MNNQTAEYSNETRDITQDSVSEMILTDGKKIESKKRLSTFKNQQLRNFKLALSLSLMIIFLITSITWKELLHVELLTSLTIIIGLLLLKSLSINNLKHHE